MILPTLFLILIIIIYSSFAAFLCAWYNILYSSFFVGIHLFLTKIFSFTIFVPPFVSMLCYLYCASCSLLFFSVYIFLYILISPPILSYPSILPQFFRLFVPYTLFYRLLFPDFLCFTMYFGLYCCLILF